MSIEQQQVFEASLPAIAWLVSYLIQQKHWSNRTNTIIAGTTIIGAAIVSLFVQHKLTSDIYGDFLLIATVAAGLQSGALAPLSQWLKNIGSKPNNQNFSTLGQTKEMPAVRDPYR